MWNRYLYDKGLVPVKEPFKSSGHRLLNVQELVNLVAKHQKPVAFFTGHYHAAKVFQEGNILYVCAPSLVTYPNAFRIIKVTNCRDKITYELEFHETTRKDIQDFYQTQPYFVGNVYSKTSTSGFKNTNNPYSKTP